MAAVPEAARRRWRTQLYLDVEGILYTRQDYSALEQEWEAVAHAEYSDHVAASAAMGAHVARWDALKALYTANFLTSARHEAERLGVQGTIEVISSTSKRHYPGYPTPGTVPPDQDGYPLEAHLWQAAFENTPMIP